MPTIKRTTPLAANGSANPLVGSQYEFLPFDAAIEVAILHDGAGTPAGEVEATMFSGSDVLLENAQIDTKAATDPIVHPDDFMIVDVAAAGERLGLTIRETAGGAPTVRTVVRITPL